MERVVAGRYALVQRLGSGGTAEVYRAEDTNLGRTVAVKVIHPRLLDDPVLAARVRAEVELAQGLSHESIVGVYGLVEEDGLAAIVMEYLPGGDLRRRLLAGGPMTPSQTRELARAILAALSFAHERGVVHRDVKPRNILFTGDGAPRLSDFGLARSMSNAGLSDRDTVAGTAEYTAPETITASLWDPRSDLYGLGCTLFEALTGSPPFAGNTPAEILRKQVEEQAPSLPEEVRRGNTALAITVASLLSKDPNDRPQTAREALQLLAGDQERPPAALAASCPHCGAQMSRAYRWCFTCHRPNVSVSGGRRGGTTVIVTGPGNRGEKFSPELRDACSRVCEALGLEAGAMRKQVPRLPFVLARGLEAASAGRLEKELSDTGAEVLLVGPGAEPKRVERRVILRKAFTMAPRVYLVIAGMTGGMFQIFTRMPPAVALGTLGTLVAAVPVVAALSYRRSVTRVSEETRDDADAALDSLLVTVADPLIHARVKSVVEAGSGLIAAVEHDETVSQEVRDTARRYVKEAVSRAATMGLALSNLREGSIYARHAAALARGGGSDRETRNAVAAVRKLDGLYTKTLEEIGSTALDIHQTRVRLARTQQSLTRKDLAAIGESITRLSDTNLAWSELEAELGSDG